MLNFLKNCQFFKTQKPNQRGQGVLEYVLVITFTVGALLFIGASMMTPINSWYKSYFGEYLECLIDAAELPSLSPRNNTDTESVCNESFAPFTLNGGRPFVGGGSGGNGGNGQGGGDQNGPGSQSGGNSGSSGNSSQNGRNRSAAGDNASRGVVIGPRQSDSSGFGLKGEADGKRTELAAKQSELESGRSKRSRTFNISNRNQNISGSDTTQLIEAQGISGNLDPRRIRKKTNDERSKVIGSVKSNDDGAGSSGGPTTRLMDKPKDRNLAAMEDVEGPSMGVAGWIKWAVIIALLVAITLFVVGQATQISKSLEK